MKISEYLDKVSSDLKELSLKVGFKEGATYPDGTPVPEVAAKQEYGGVSEVFDWEIGKKVTIFIPPRPAFRNAISENRAEWRDGLIRMLKAGDSSQVALEKLGLKIEGDIFQSYATLTSPELSRKTISNRRIRKDKPKNQSTKPLVDTKVLIHSITSWVDK